MEIFSRNREKYAKTFINLNAINFRAQSFSYKAFNTFAFPLLEFALKLSFFRHDTNNKSCTSHIINSFWRVETERKKVSFPFRCPQKLRWNELAKLFQFHARRCLLNWRNFLMKISFIPFCLLFRAKNRTSCCKARSSKLNIYDVRLEWMKKKIILRTAEINFETFYKHFNYDYTYSFYAFGIRCYARGSTSELLNYEN